MLGQIFSALGNLVGGRLGGGILSTIGRFTGKFLGNYLEEQLFNEDEDLNEYYKENSRLNDLSTAPSRYGTPIPLVFGYAKINGKIIWSCDLEEVLNASSEVLYNNQEQEKGIKYINQYIYFATFAIGLCQGEITDIGRVWINNELYNISSFKYYLYKGTEDQTPDPLIEAKHGKNCTPAFRGLAYIVFEKFPLAKFNNKIPEFRIEILRKLKATKYTSVEDLVTSMIIIPGSGEFVYDTEIQYKSNIEDEEALGKEYINCHNYKHIANSIFNLDVLASTCSNIKWVAPVVCWFGTNLDAQHCNVLPAVEYNEPGTKTSEEWRVGKFSRDTAHLIGKDKQNNPRYGGTVNDNSLIRYLKELKRREYKIMFYPLFLIDLEDKPWRGHVTGIPDAIEGFFTKENGYNNFILHYANLLKDLVDAFVIGSELVGITKVHRENFNFPAVKKLVALAQSVKEILGDKVLVTYAADWSEYHHTDEGWYHLDELWASKYIDMIGIDAYFPITDSQASNISEESILKGFASGEGYEYYYDNERKKSRLESKYAWKNIKYWWENFHYNPNDKATLWKPKLKKIWFTEFGFPSVDKATNQPNMFYNPDCYDGGVPKYSNSVVDFTIQRRAIKAAIQHWKKEEYIENMFLWTWDARPYPAWPHGKVWGDGNLWSRGHWVNNKFGVVTIKSIITEICNIVGIQDIDANQLDEPIDGLALIHNTKAVDVINLLRCCYFFDILSVKNLLCFVKRGKFSSHKINYGDLVKLDQNEYSQITTLASNQILRKITINFLNIADEYKFTYCCSSLDYKEGFEQTINLPLMMTIPIVESIANTIIYSARSENKIFHFKLPIGAYFLKPSDVISLTEDNHVYVIRLIDVSINKLEINIIGIIENIESYKIQIPNYQIDNLSYTPDVIQFEIIDLPLLYTLNNDLNSIGVVYCGNKKQDLYLGNNIDNLTNVSQIHGNGIIGYIKSFHNFKKSSKYFIDNISSFDIYSSKPLPEMTEQQFEKGDSLSLIGREIIRYRYCEKIGKNIYRITGLLRGEFGTYDAISTHEANEKFILLNNVHLIKIPHDMIGQKLYCKIGKCIKQIEFNAISQKLMSPTISYSEIKNDKLHIAWHGYNRNYDNWLTPHISECEKYMINIVTNSRTQQFYTKNESIIINLTQNSLNAPLEISIISIGTHLLVSNPTKISILK